jgi:alginate O-acetyltransferase complex protein AlgI
MVFSSAVFLFLFFPAFLLTYFFTPQRFKNLVLLLFSVGFYAWGAPKFVYVVLATTALDFYLVRSMYACRGTRKSFYFLLLSVSVNLGLLFYFKYCGFFVQNVNGLLHTFGFTNEILFTAVLMPVGISFYTFETITYVVDVYRGVHRPLNNFLDYQAYIMLFPKLIAGPIVRYHEIAGQLTNRSANETPDNRLNGFFRFSIGLAKKVLVANTLAQVANAIYGDPLTGEGMANPEMLSLSQAWIGALAYTFQIYFDFSGYSDMAIGIARMIGFRFPENFNHPYVSQSITEFWRRWHITLGNWMRNYVYIPLGGNRVEGKARLFFNLWIVFLLSGLWHGASWNFIVWGAWHGTFLILDRWFLEKVLRHAGKPIRVLFTFLMVVVGWIFFRVTDLTMAWKFILALFHFGNSGFTYDFTNEFFITLTLAIFFSFFAVFSSTEKISDQLFEGTTNFKVQLLNAAISVFFILLSTAYLVSGGFNPFIYFRF